MFCLIFCLILLPLLRLVQKVPPILLNNGIVHYIYFLHNAILSLEVFKTEASYLH